MDAYEAEQMANNILNYKPGVEILPNIKSATKACPVCMVSGHQNYMGFKVLESEKFSNATKVEIEYICPFCKFTDFENIYIKEEE